MTTLRKAAQQALEALGLWATGRDMDAVELNDLIFRLEAALAEPTLERNFCPRCGKRTRGIHTCTPPHGIGEQK